MDRTDWARHITTWRESGESGPKYCEREGLKISALRYWAGRLKELEGAPCRLARVRRKGGPDGKSLRIHVGGAALEVPVGFDAKTLARVLDLLGGRR